MTLWKNTIVHSVSHLQLATRRNCRCRLLSSVSQLKLTRRRFHCQKLMTLLQGMADGFMRLGVRWSSHIKSHWWNIIGEFSSQRWLRCCMMRWCSRWTSSHYHFLWHFSDNWRQASKSQQHNGWCCVNSTSRDVWAKEVSPPSTELGIVKATWDASLWRCSSDTPRRIESGKDESVIKM